MTVDPHQLQETLGPLLSRRSVSPKRLTSPGPDEAALGLMIQTALRAPDHGGLHPWRLIEFPESGRQALADCFEQEKLRRDPLASRSDLDKAREHALRPPLLLGFVVSPRARTPVPAREQLLAAGAALGNLLNAAHQLGFGASILSGERCFDAQLLVELGLGPEEWLAGFVSMGTIERAPPAAQRAAASSIKTRWDRPARPMADD